MDNLKIVLPYFDSCIPAGFPSPAQDYMEEEIDLQKLLIPNPLSTFLIRVKGNSMVNAFIPENAILLVDRSPQPRPGDIVVAVVNGEFTVKRLMKNKSNYILQPENPGYKALEITSEMDFEVWGIVIHIIIDPKKCNDRTC